MTFLKTAASAAAITLLMGTGALVVTTAPASARMVCNNSGDCWHTESRTNYAYPGSGYTRHNDDWYFHQTWNDQRHYREPHQDRGYYKGGVWIGF